MAEVHKGRFTTEVDCEIVVFIIGMSVNKPWKVWKWWPVFVAMPRILAYLKAHPEKGLLGYSGLFPVVQYWRSFEDLDRFARDRMIPTWPRGESTFGGSGAGATSACGTRPTGSRPPTSSPSTPTSP